MTVFSCSLGGLHLHADFPLHGVLAESVRSPDVRIMLGRGTAPVGNTVFAWPGRYGLRLATLGNQFLFSSARDGTFLVSRSAQELQCFPPADAPAGTTVPDGMLQLLMRRVLPRVAELHGRTGLHGASIMLDPYRAMLVLGASGAGKSTLSAALQRECGWTVLSDDISLIDCASAPARCFSVVQGACLWPDSLAALAGSDMRSHALPAHDQKRWREFDSAAPARSASISTVVFLEKNDIGAHGPSLQALAPQQALMGAMRQLIRFNPCDHAALESEMGNLARLLRATPAYTLSYPRSYAALPAVAQYLSSFFDAERTAANQSRESYVIE